MVLVGWSVQGQRPSSTTIRSAGSESSNLFGDEIVARGKGFKITRQELDDAFTSMKVSAAAQGQTISGTSTS